MANEGQVPFDQDFEAADALDAAIYGTAEQPAPFDASDILEKTGEITSGDYETAIAALAGGDPFLPGGPGLGDFIAQSPGIVMDPAIAREAPCIGYHLAAEGPRADVVFVEGVRGALDQAQIESFCSEVDLRELTPEMRDRLVALGDSRVVCRAEIADLTDPSAILDTYAGCMGREMRDRGQRL